MNRIINFTFGANLAYFRPKSDHLKMVEEEDNCSRPGLTDDKCGSKVGRVGQKWGKSDIFGSDQKGTFSD